MSPALRSILGLALPAALLFLSAGRLAWPQAWLFLSLLVLASLVLGLWLRRTDPSLLEERMKSPLSANQRPRDRAIMTAMLAAFAAWIVLMGLDARFGWSHLPAWAQAIGAALFVAPFWGWMRVLQANSYASVTVRVQADRGQTVISTGPYAWVRHPMYALALVWMLGGALLLGTVGGLLGMALLIPLLVARTLGEEAVLLAGLPGYREYAARVRFRLLPGIW